MDKALRILAFFAMLLLIPVCKTDRPGTLKWKYQTGGPIMSSPAIGQDGTIYIGSEDSCLYAFDPDGNLEWKYQADDMIWSSPAIGDDGTVYFSSRESHTYALTPEGELKWKYQTYSISSPAIGHGGTLYVAALNGHLYAITPEGKLKWESPARGLDMFPPVIGLDGTLYSCGFNKVFAHDSLGNLKWSFETPMNVTISAFGIDLDGNLCFCTWSSEFYVLTPQGELKARVGARYVFTNEWTSPLIDTDGSVYLGGIYFYALNPGYTKKWMLAKEIGYGGVESTPTIGSDGTLYITVNDVERKGSKRKRVGYLYAFTPESERKWRCKLGGEIKSSPAIGSDGTVYVGSLDSCVYAVHSDSKGLADSPWPKFQHDNQNTGRAGGGN